MKSTQLTIFMAMILAFCFAAQGWAQEACSATKSDDSDTKGTCPMATSCSKDAPACDAATKTCPKQAGTCPKAACCPKKDRPGCLKKRVCPKSGKLMPEWWVDDDFTWVRGANYIPSYAYNDIAQWHQYDPEVIDRELSYAKQLNLNSVRVWMSYYPYELDSEQYMKNFENLLATADKHGLTVMPILFDGCFGEGEPSLDTKAWVPSPGPSRMLEEHRDEMYKYLDDIVGNYIGDPRILFWDIMNEPSSMGSPKLFRGLGNDYAYEFARIMGEYVNKLDDTHPVVVGVGNHKDIPKVIDYCDVITFHCYQAFEKAFDLEITKARELSGDKAMLITETEACTMGSTPQLTFRKFREHNVGWYFFSLMMGECGVCLPSGAFDTNGVSYYPDYIAAIHGIQIPLEAQMDRFDRFDIARICEEAKTVPTNADNLSERRHASGELVRCLNWAGLDTREVGQSVITALKLLEEGKNEEAYPYMDEVLIGIGKMAEEAGFFAAIHEPTIKELNEARLEAQKHEQ